jgi:hypothetical protein
MWTMNDQGYVQLRIEIRPSSETNDHEVRLMADGESLVDRFSTGLIGLDPHEPLENHLCHVRRQNSRASFRSRPAPFYPTAVRSSPKLDPGERVRGRL